MRKLIALIAALALTMPAVVAAHPGHHHKQKVRAYASGDWSCSYWASHDPAHPNAPGSYRSYGCSNPGGDWAWVVGTGYSGTMHTTKLQRRCMDSLPILGCIQWRVIAWEHYHS